MACGVGRRVAAVDAHVRGRSTNRPVHPTPALTTGTRERITVSARLRRTGRGAVRALRVRALTAGAASLGAMGAMLVSATPAAACSCGGGAEIPAEFEPGHTLAIVTRTDGGPGADALGNALPVATFRVE